MQTAGQRRAQALVVILTAIVVGIAVVFAWRHVRQGRADVRGASRAGAVIFACSLVSWACTANHLPDAFAELTGFSWGVSSAAFAGGVFWALYVAIEPHVRRRKKCCDRVERCPHLRACRGGAIHCSPQ
jgi:uncharacterized membrane protein YfcA